MKQFVLCAFALAVAAVTVMAALPTPEQLVSAFDSSVINGVDFAMATLAANKVREYQMGDKEEYPVIAADIIYQGAAVGENAAGYARPLQGGDVFLGFSEAKADNAAGAAGAIGVNVKKRGNIVLPIAGLAITANDRPAVYASDDDTFTLTALGNSLIGYVSRWTETGYAVVEFDAALSRAALQA